MEKINVYQQQTQSLSPGYKAPAQGAGFAAPSQVMGAQTGGYGMPSQGMGMGYGQQPSYGMGYGAQPGYGMGPVNQGPTNVAPAHVSPTQNTVNTNVSKTVVPYVHPTHNTTVNKHIIQNQHYFPHSESVVNECYTQDLICSSPPPMPMHKHCCPPRPHHF